MRKHDLPAYTCPAIDKAINQIHNIAGELLDLEAHLEDLRDNNESLRSACCDLIDENKELTDLVEYLQDENDTLQNQLD